MSGFAWYDYVIFASLLAISMGTGIYQALTGGRQRTTSEYLMGDRKLLMIPVAISMFMSRVSAIMILGNSAEVYNYGVTGWTGCVGVVLSLIYATPLLVPTVYKLKLTSIYEYLETRYDSKVARLTATVLNVISSLSYCGIALYSPATALAAVTSIPTWVSIVTTGVVVTLYTMIGGMKAVIWTDVIQGLVMALGIILILVFGSEKTGGFAAAWKIAGEEGRLDVNFSMNPLVRVSFWSTVMSQFFNGMYLAASQNNTQRYSSVTSQSAAMWTSVLDAAFYILVYSLTSMIGVVVFAYYYLEGCDPLRSGVLSSSNQILPHFIVNDLGVPALPGLFVAVLFSGALSSVSSNLTSMVATLWKDIIEPFVPPKLSENRRALINKCLVLLVGAISVLVSFLNSILPGHVMQIASSISGAVGGPMAGIFVMSLFFPCTNWIGVFGGALIGFGFGISLSIGSYMEWPYRTHLNTSVIACATNVSSIPDDPDGVLALWRISFHYFSVLAILVTAASGLLISLITGPRKPSTVPSRLMAPCADALCCYLPLKIRTIFWCGVDFEQTEDTEMIDADSVALDKEKGNLPKPLSFKSINLHIDNSAEPDEKASSWDTAYINDAYIPSLPDKTIKTVL